MKILWLSHLIPYPPKGGVLQRSFNLIKEAGKQHEIFLLAINQQAFMESTKTDLESARKVFENICKQVEFIDVPTNKKNIAIKSLFSSLPYTALWRYFEFVDERIKNIIEKDKIDLIHFDSVDVAQYRRTIVNTCTVLNHHNIESQMMFRRSANEANILKKIFYFWEAFKLKEYEKKVCPTFNNNLVVSDLDKERLIEVVNDIRVETVPNGVDTDYFKPVEGKYTKGNLIFAGSMSWYPNSAAMLYFFDEIWPILSQKDKDITFTLVGREPPEQVVELSKKDNRINVTGFVDDVRPYLEAANVYICPITDGGGTKLKILDAMAMKKAIVAHPISVEGLDVKEGLNILLAKSPEQFTKQTLKLINDEQLCRELGENARKCVLEKYTFAAIGSNLADIYDNVVQVKN
jgi:glycosyltransferase involved in cell wall biosynthesis